MKKEKFNELCAKSGFIIQPKFEIEQALPKYREDDKNLGECRVYTGNYFQDLAGPIDIKLNKLKNLLLDEVIKEIGLIVSNDEFVNVALKAAIEKVEEMKCN